MRNILMIAVVMAATFLGVRLAGAETRTVGHHGVWDISCSGAENASPPADCMLLLDLGEGPDLHSVSVKRRPDGHVSMRLTFVFGIYLPRGVDLVFDGDKKGRLPFDRCLPDNGGCIVEFDATPLVERLKVGGVMTLAFSREINSTTTANVSVDGFAEALSALDALGPSTSTVPPQAQTAADHGAWKMLCDNATDGAGTRRCNAIQSANDPETGSLVSFVLVKRPDRGLLIHVSVSGDILIKPGLTLLIDGQPQGVVQFDVCGQAGCMVEVQLADIVVSRLKAGAKATLAYRIRPDKAMNMSFALDGFSAAYQAVASGD